MATMQINKYVLLAPLDNDNAGFSRWTFARYAGKLFFLKEFQDVVYPDQTTLSPTLRNNRIRECQEFEKVKTRLYQGLNRISDGNVIRAHEFFRYDSHYYLATEKVEGEKLTLEEVAQLPMQDRLLICRTLAHALMRLHSAGIVHSDVKKTNVLLKKTATGKLTAKLIDFDAGFFEDTPPECEEELHFDQPYLAPEGCLFTHGEPVELSCKMDVFSAGLLMHEYLTGKRPGFPSEFGHAHEAVLEGHELELSPKLAPEIRQILKRMLVCDPEERCDMAEVFRAMGVFFGTDNVAPPPPPEPPEPPVDPEPPTDPNKFDRYFIPAGDL